MLYFYFKKAIKDILDNRFLNVITVITIALSIMIASAFVLFFINADDVVNSWKKGIRIMAYLKPGLSEPVISAVEDRIDAIAGVAQTTFISKETALERLKKQMRHQASLFEDLTHNPLPDAIEIRMVPSRYESSEVESLARQIEGLVAVESVEYGQLWFRRFSNMISLFRLTGYALGGLFFMAAVFIVANTIRIVLYSRRDEIDIMRLVGAADGFIKAPFYIEGVILGGVGGMVGLCTLFIGFLVIAANVGQSFAGGFFQVRFLSFSSVTGIVVCSTLVGWLGCYLSLKQFMKT